MNDKNDDLDSYLIAAASLIGLPPEVGASAGVKQNFARIAELAALVNGFELPDDVEPAPVMRHD